MVTIVTRSGKGSALTNAEIDTNFTNLNTGKVEDVTARASYLPSLVLDFANGKSLDPRVTFTRASTATYYDGVTVAKAEENLLVNSAHPINSGWSIQGGYAGTLGAELVANGDFSSSAGWGVGAGWSIDSGVATANTTQGSDQIARNWSGANGKSYVVTATVTMLATPTPGASVAINVGGNGQDLLVYSQNTMSSGSTYAINSVVRSTGVAVGSYYVRVGSNLNYAMNYTIDDVSIKELIADNVIAPDGTATAVTLTASAANATFTQSVSLNAGDHTFSVWLRRKTGTGNVDITAHSGDTWVTQTITSSWARYTVTQTLTAGTRTPGIRIATAGDQVEVWGAQLEQRSSVTAYTPTTTAPITNYVPRLLTAPANTPRFQHDPITGESLGLLVEEQRTNLWATSQSFSSGGTGVVATYQNNTVIAPDGTLTACKIVSNASNTLHGGGAVVSLSASTSYVLSLFAKAEKWSRLAVRGWWDGVSYRLPHTTVDLVTKQTLQAGTTPTITDVGNGWLRISFPFSTSGAVSGGVVLEAHNTQFAQAEEQGDGYSGIYIWGAQVEDGAFPTSYIPTAGSQVTRSADAPSMTGTNFSSWFNPNEGTVLVEAQHIAPSVAAQQFQAQIASDSGNYIAIFKDASPTDVTARVRSGAADQVYLYTTDPISANTTYRTALGYAANNFASCTNGGALQTDTSGLLPLSATALGLGQATYTNSVALNGYLRRFAYYPERLSNADLQSLTA